MPNPESTTPPSLPPRPLGDRIPTPVSPPRRPPPAPPQQKPVTPHGAEPLSPLYQPSSGSGWIWLIAVLIVGGAGWWWLEYRGQAEWWSGEGASDSAASEALSGEESGGGEVLLIAKPWGRIEKMVEGGDGTEVPLPKGSPFTPRLATLPSGRYEISLSHPDGGSRTCEVEITAGSKSTCEVRFFEIEPREYFQEVGW